MGKIPETISQDGYNSAKEYVKSKPQLIDAYTDIGKDTNLRESYKSFCETYPGFTDFGGRKKEVIARNAGKAFAAGIRSSVAEAKSVLIKDSDREEYYDKFDKKFTEKCRSFGVEDDNSISQLKTIYEYTNRMDLGKSSTLKVKDVSFIGL